MLQIAVYLCSSFAICSGKELFLISDSIFFRLYVPENDVPTS